MGGLLSMTSRESIRTALEGALDQLRIDHEQLFHSDANERSLTHWLAAILAPRFPGWDVDCEYNRDGFAPKRIRIRTEVPSDDLNAETVFPDIIVHRRGTADNLLVVEAKKSNNREGDTRDRQKLEAFMSGKPDGLGYKFGALVVFGVENGGPGTNVELWPPT
jgi:hypothetical protein